jgi:hypothetical protein
MIIQDECKLWNWKDVGGGIVVYLKIFHHFRGGTEENQENNSPYITRGRPITKQSVNHSALTFGNLNGLLKIH